MRRPAALLAFLLTLAACQSDPGPVMAPPDGWTTDGRSKWWRAAADTTGRFPNHDSFAAMGVRPPQDPLAAQVQRGLRTIYRFKPQAVDSLFQRFAEPMIAETPTSRTLDVRKLRTDVYRTLVTHFRFPQETKQLPLILPDSLAGRNARVELQVYVNAEGLPEAIERLGPPQGGLDLVAMGLAVQQVWTPAYLGGQPTDAWVRYSIPFGTPPPPIADEDEASS